MEGNAPEVKVESTARGWNGLRAAECAAILDVGRRLNLIEDAPYRTGRWLLLRIVAMLVQMVQRTGETGPGTGSGTGARTK